VNRFVQSGILVGEIIPNEIDYTLFLVVVGNNKLFVNGTSPIEHICVAVPPHYLLKGNMIIHNLQLLTY
jgi:hypothetical protein